MTVTLRIALSFDDLAWQDDAACLDRYDVDWFPERGRSTDAAKAICADCLVRDECLTYALSFGAPMPGVFGGLSEMERRRLRARPMT